MKNPTLKLLPVLFGFYVMGFCDVVGIATSYAQKDFALNETLAGFIPSMVFIWFLLIPVPAALLMNRLGRKTMVQMSNIITIVGMAIPFLHYDFVTCMAGFVMLGIGNTVLQVSLNPLLTNIVGGKALTSSLTAGQVIKAVSSFAGPFIAMFAASYFGSWMYIFPIYAVITVISAVWLFATPIQESESASESASFSSTMSLLGNKTILLLFLGIVAVVGVDVGINTVSPKLMIERAHMDVASAGLASSVYFFCRTAGALIGTILLSRINDNRYFRIHIVIACIAMAALYFASATVAILILIGAIGYGCSSIFSVIYANALKAQPDKTNALSGLMITGVCGGAVVPPLMGVASDAIGSQTGSLLVISIAMAYLLICSISMKNQK